MKMWHWGTWLVGLVGMDWWLNWMILKVFPNLNDPKIPYKPGELQTGRGEEVRAVQCVGVKMGAVHPWCYTRWFADSLLPVGVSPGFGLGFEHHLSGQLGTPGLHVPGSSPVMFPSTQVGEVVDVDAEMAAILQSSRFAEKFLIRAGGTDGAAPQGCCCGKMKVGS